MTRANPPLLSVINIDRDCHYSLVPPWRAMAKSDGAACVLVAAQKQPSRSRKLITQLRRVKHHVACCTRRFISASFCRGVASDISLFSFFLPFHVEFLHASGWVCDEFSSFIMGHLNGTRLGAFRAYFFGFFVCTAGFLFGYDTGIVGECYHRVELESLEFRRI